MAKKTPAKKAAKKTLNNAETVENTEMVESNKGDTIKPVKSAKRQLSVVEQMALDQYNSKKEFHKKLH